MNPFTVGKVLGRLSVFLQSVAKKVGDNREIKFFKKGELVFNKGFYPDVLKPYGIKHPGRGFDYSWSWISEFRL